VETSVTIDAPLGAPRRTPAAKIRILETATVLFSRDGIRAVGVDRLIHESSVTKATFYKHFGSKDRLIRDYLTAASADTLAAIDRTLSNESSSRSALLALADSLYATVCADDFRGSLFVNAAAEFSHKGDPVRVIIAEHHEAVSTIFTRVLQRQGHPLPGEAADELMMAYVGALAWGHVGDPVGAALAFRRHIDGVLADGAQSG